MRVGGVTGGRAAAAAMLLASLAAGMAPADAATSASNACHPFAIPAQPLATALLAFGKQADLQVLVAGELAARFRSRGVDGCLSPSDGLAALLHGTGLTFAFTGVSSVAIRAAPEPVVRPDAKATPPRLTVRQLPSVQAIGFDGGDSGFLAALTSIASRNDVDLIDAPQSIGVVTRSLMDSQQDLSVADVVRNIAGVGYVDGSDGLPQFQIRGFYTGNGTIDGMPASIDGSGDYPPLIGLERVEVFKGPQSILGDTTGNTFGGLVNVTLKQPQSQPVHRLSYSLGEQGRDEVGIDLAGPLGQVAGLSYRLIGSGQYGERSPQGYRGRRSAYLAAALGWRRGGTDLVLGAQRILNRMPTPDHVIVLGDSLSSASPFGLLPGNPHDYANYQTDRLYALLEQSLGDAWSWRGRAQYVQQRNDHQGWTLASPSPDGEVLALAQAYRYDAAYYSLQNDLIRVFGTGATTHTLTFGLDYSRSRVGHVDDYLLLYGDSYDIFTDGPLPRVSTLLQAGDDQAQPGTPWTVDSGVFVQDQVALGERWDLTLAVRRAAYEIATDDLQGNPWNTHRIKWVPNLGVVYKLAPDIAVYASAANGFQATSYLGGNARPLPPALSRQLEGGLKFELFDQRARLTVSLYRIMLDHSYLLVSEQPPYFATLGPGQTNRGLETELVGRLAPGLDLSVNYTDARVSNHDHTPPTGAPWQRFNLWASYWFQGAALRGWGLAGGIQARSRSRGQSSDYSTYFTAPGQAELGFNVSRRADRWRFTLGVRNLLGRRLYADDFDETFVPVRSGCSVLLSGDFDF